MKTIFYSLLCALSLAAIAQGPSAIEVVQQPNDNGEPLAFAVVIPQTHLKEVEKDWLKYTGRKSRGEATEVNGVHLQDGATNKNISSKPFEVYSTLLEATEGVHLTVWLMQDSLPFVSERSNRAVDLAAQKYVRDFAIAEYREAVREELKMEERKQKEMEKELAGLIEDQERSRKTINENNRGVRRSNEAIATNNSDIETTSDKIYYQKGMVDKTATDPQANKGAGKTLDNMEGDKKDLQKKNDKQGENIYDMRKENRAEKRSIVNNAQSTELKMADIETQKQKVRDLRIKLESIK